MASKYFETIKKYYLKKKYTKKHLAALVKAGSITAEEYKLITGEEYVA